MTEQEFVEKMKAGAILCRNDMGASTWCHLEFPDGTTENVTHEPGDHWPLNESYPVPLEAIGWDNRQVPNRYRIQP